MDILFGSAGDEIRAVLEFGMEWNGIFTRIKQPLTLLLLYRGPGQIRATNSCDQVRVMYREFYVSDC